MTGGWTWAGRFIQAAGLPPEPSFSQVVNAVASVPYGRPPCRTPEGAIEAWRGTCSTKHLLLALVCRDLFPERQMELVHRVYRLLPDEALRLFGSRAAAAVPSGGLVDVHTYATGLVGGARQPIDVTFPLAREWDGSSPMVLSCPAGEDHPGGANPLASKALLEMEHRDPAVREPFVAALTEASRSRGSRYP
ncbi:hypothetical protein [Vulgatibacter incomptus]|uniref:Uncharacterized protein n=1 Tax=Vulgatibacter incomptus TaxID=1391653 RepID=A0A0K1P9E6_9BACT|nr:hypothetical protein [Vulgatibacter incomptus]AKU90137.1 hypothetical protein AKJ08_0524 [Vulgatibacter incomptus]